MRIKGTFRFHKVGQGLFYSGILNTGAGRSNRVFNFVYDCGSESPKIFRDREIDDYKMLLPNRRTSGGKELDLLVISHLHDDHVNGLDRLLDGVKVDTVVMPYTSDGLLLMARLESRNDEAFLQTFYTDPISWFVGKGVRRVILIGADIQEEEHRRAWNGEDRTDDRFGVQIDPDGVLGSEEIDGTQVLYYESHLKMHSHCFCWMFQFENLAMSGNKLVEYINVVERYKQSKNLVLEDMLRSKRLINELKNKIKEECGNILNRTSVVMEHGPTEDTSRQVWNTIYIHRPWIYVHKRGPKFQEIGIPCMSVHNMTILTGDVELKNQEEMDLLSDGPCKYCLVLQYPHHGSRNNSVEKFTHRDPSTIVLSYGIVNRYGHPNEEDFLGQPRHIVLVNERESFDYQIYVE